MSVEATSPTAVVNNTIMAAADEILAGLKDGNFVLRIPPRTEGPDHKEPKCETNGCVSPTAVHYHDHTTAIDNEHGDMRSHAESIVSQVSQVTFDSRDGRANAAPETGGIVKIASASSLTSHPDGTVDTAAHKGQVLEGPPMHHVAFAWETKASVGGTPTSNRGRKRAASEPSWDHGGAEKSPSSEKPRLPPTERGSLWFPPQTTGTTVKPQLIVQLQPELANYHQSSCPKPTQAERHLTFQPILPAVTNQESGPSNIAPGCARVFLHQRQHQVRAQQTPHTQEQANKHPQQQNEQIDHQHLPHDQARANREPRTNLATLGQPSSGPVAPLALSHHPHLQLGCGQIHGTFQLALKPPGLKTRIPVELAPRRTEQGSPGTGQHHSQGSMLGEPQQKVTEVTESQRPGSINPAHSRHMTLAEANSPICPTSCPTLWHHNQETPPQHQRGEPQVKQANVPFPSPYSAQHHYVSTVSPRTCFLDTSSVQLHETNHQYNVHNTENTSEQGVKATLVAARSHPVTRTTSPYFHFDQHGHTVNNHQQDDATCCHKPSNGEVATPTVSQTHTYKASAESSWVHPSNGVFAAAQYHHFDANAPDHRSSELAPSLRNQKMQPTDCLLFAASLLQEGPCPASPSTLPDTTVGLPPSWIKERTSVASLPDHFHGEYIQTLSAAPAKRYIAHGSTAMEAAPLPTSAQGEESVPVNTAVVPQPVALRDQPQDVDVLCGRGGLINKHIGNIIYRKVCEYNKPFYQTVQKRHRILVSQSIVHTILKRGGRFLSEDTQTVTCPNGTQVTVTVWKPVTTARAIQKTSQALRERLASKDIGGNESQNGSSS